MNSRVSFSVPKPSAEGAPGRRLSVMNLKFPTAVALHEHALLNEHADQLQNNVRVALDAVLEQVDEYGVDRPV